MQSDPALHTALLNVGTPNNAFDIAYHMWWPSPTDPFYLANTVENTARQSYYNITGTPSMKCDGTTASWPSIQSIIQARMAVTSPLWMDEIITANASAVNVTIKVVSTLTITNNTVIHAVLLDRYSYLPSSPNGQPHHYHAMLDMAPNGNGQNFTATAGDTMTYTASFPMNPSWNVANLDVASFVQNNTSKEVMQSRCEQVPVNFPGLTYQSYTLQDNGNNDGRAEPGETPYMYITLANGQAFQSATNVVGTLSTTDPTLTITTPTVTFPNIPNGGTGTNANPFVFQVSSSATAHLSSLHLHVLADPGQTAYDVDIPIFIGWPNVLLIDDDGGQGTTMETYYFSTLQAMNEPYESWEIATQGVPSLTLVSNYASVIWFTAYQYSGVLSAAEQALIQGYLNQGGCLFINGQNLAWGLSTQAPAFLSQVLHASYLINDPSIRILPGVAGNPVGNGLTLNINSGGSGSGSATSPDGIGVLAPAQEAFIYQGSATYKGGLTYDDAVTGHKLVFFSFPFEAVNGLPGSNSRAEVLAAMFDFFAFAGPSNPNVTVTLLPVNPPIIIPPQGGSFDWDITLHNGETTPQTLDVWTIITLPGGSTRPGWGPFMNLTMPAGATINRVRTQNIVDRYPPGAYTYTGKIGAYPDSVWDSDSFPFTKAAAGDGGWASNESSAALTPAEYALHGAIPNPFNPTTTLSFALPQAGPVKLSVYNVTGREVATLVNGWRNAGNHEVTFDATGLASGLYIYQLTAGDFHATGKMMLTK